MPSDSPAVHRTLYMSAETGRELAERPAAAFLIGGYDGCGNYGDIAQLEAALQLLADLGDGAFALPLVDLRYLESHRRRSLAPTPNFDPARVLAFSLGGADSTEAAANLGFVPASLPEEISRTVTYLYGGGYLNSRWASRMLMMIEAVEALAARAGVAQHEMISSGLQIEPRWALGLGPEAKGLLAGLRQVGVRDEHSAQAAIHFTDGERTPAVLRSGDDAVGVLESLVEAASSPRPISSDLVLNLHLCSHAWVTDDAERLLSWLQAFILALAECSDRRLRLQPVIAYEDDRISERPTLERFLPGLVARDAAAPPIVLARPEAAETASTLAAAELTVATSYHVALSSLLAGIPAILVCENDYYSQKAQGLARDFALPPALFPSPGLEPREAASAVLRALADADGPLRRESLTERAREVLSRRRAAESELRRELHQVLGAWPASEPSERKPSVAAEDRDVLLASLDWAHARIEWYEENRALQEQHFRDLTQTVSWRLTAPIRAVKNQVASRAHGRFRGRRK